MNLADQAVHRSPEHPELALQHARRLYQRVLAGWASDMLRWQASGREAACPAAFVRSRQAA
ncbi:MAG: hypothetical protein KDA22_12760 [Phycisphaerales bacterium]|nr:hypothetical protein [Phycisphaerales bacterium]